MTGIYHKNGLKDQRARWISIALLIVLWMAPNDSRASIVEMDKINSSPVISLDCIYLSDSLELSLKFNGDRVLQFRVPLPPCTPDGSHCTFEPRDLPEEPGNLPEMEEEETPSPSGDDDSEEPDKPSDK